jgi:hypothetical protein
VTRACEDCDDEAPLMTGSTSASRGDDEDDLPGLYIPDPESRSGYRIWWVRRPKPGGPPRRQIGFRA